uniref:Uncharacterized protein n=1 Tax=Arundo donax TaxID=35708 RepID=A0A0A8XQ29_ARUDO
MFAGPLWLSKRLYVAVRGCVRV